MFHTTALDSMFAHPLPVPQVVNHGLPQETHDAFSTAMKSFFRLPLEQKLRLKRTESNSRGFAHDELTKQLKVGSREKVCLLSGFSVCLNAPSILLKEAETATWGPFERHRTAYAERVCW